MAEKILDVEIVTPQKVVFSGQTSMVSVPGAKGTFQLLYNHAPIVSSLDIGTIVVADVDGKRTAYATNGGFVEVRNNRISILVETAKQPSEIDVAAVAEQKRALSEELEQTTNFSRRESIKLDIAKANNLLRTAEM